MILFRFSIRLFCVVAIFASALVARGQAGAGDPHRAAIEEMMPLMIAALEAGKFDHAREMCEKAIGWQPANPVHRYNLACIEARAGVATQARAMVALEQAMAMGFNDAELLQTDTDLDSLRSDPRFPALVATAARNALTPPDASGRRRATPPLPAATPAALRDTTADTSNTASEQPAPEAPKRLPALDPKRGFIIGRAITADGRPVPEFTVAYSGFEDGKLATSFGGSIIETVKDKKRAVNGTYEVPLPAGAYRVSAYVTYRRADRVYHFPLEPLNLPAVHDYRGLQLDKLNDGLVRDFVLRMTGPRAGASEATESVYKQAYFGGRVDFDARQQTGILGGGNKLAPALRDSFPAASRITVTFTPQGPMIDGSAGKPIVTNLALGDDGKWTFCQRGLFPGSYVATARLTTPDGRDVPLHVSRQPARSVVKGAGDHDALVADWQTSVTFEFLPNSLGPEPRFGVTPIKLYLGP